MGGRVDLILVLVWERAAKSSRILTSAAAKCGSSQPVRHKNLLTDVSRQDTSRRMGVSEDARDLTLLFARR